jgi:iron-sulfur cluster repair protein YtfE (RIC family)
VVIGREVKMRLHTASETISFAKELEEKSAKFYKDLAQRYSKDEDVLLSYAKENNKYFTQIQRAYYSVITDAIEGGYAFDLEVDEHTLDIELPEKASYSDALDKAVEIEEKMIKFYTVAAEQSMSLMADVPRNFKIVARKRSNRISKLKLLA